MGRTLLKFVLCNVFALGLTMSVYGQNNNTNGESAKYDNAEAISLNTSKPDISTENADVSDHVSLEQSNAALQKTMDMYINKSKLLDKKIGVITEIMIITLEYINQPKISRKEIDTYMEKLAGLEQEMEATEVELKVMDALIIEDTKVVKVK